MNNMIIRDQARQARVNLWEIAYALNMTDSNFSRKLRLELADEEQKRILNIIDDIWRRREDETL